MVNQDVTDKIISGLERISEAYKVLLWEKAKLYGISPIQIQILTFINNHKEELNNVSYLAKEFNVTKPTISDAVRVLHNKNFIEKDFSNADSRRYTLFLTKEGKALLKEIGDYFNPIAHEIRTMDNDSLNQLYGTLSSLIYQLHKKGILTVQRTCYGCKFYSKHDNTHHCSLINANLLNNDIRIDCPEFEEK